MCLAPKWTSTRSRHTSVSSRTVHHHRYKSRHIATSHSPSRRSIPQAPTRDAHQWQHTTSKPAIPHLDARFHKHPLETNISGMTAHQNQLSPSRRSIRRGTIRSFTNRSDSVKAGSRVWTLIDAYFHPTMRDKATTCRSECLKAVSQVWTLVDAYFNPAIVGQPLVARETRR